jgi:AbrB family looped-hinge helix DNA binding protein
MHAEIGTISARGQVAIPANIRQIHDLKEGDQVLFVSDGKNLMLKKPDWKKFLELSEPLRNAKKKIQEEDVVGLVHAYRRKHPPRH